MSLDLKRIFFEDAKYSCNLSDYKTIETHIMNSPEQDEDVEYSCKQCEFRVKYIKQLMRQTHTVHEGQNFCGECEFRAADKGSVQIHQQQQQQYKTVLRLTKDINIIFVV